MTEVGGTETLAPIKVLLIGASGQLGKSLIQLAPAWWRLTSPSSRDLDLRSEASVKQGVAEAQPHIIINCAAYTDVDGAESQPRIAELVNTCAPSWIAEASRSIQNPSRVVQVSTDYVFGLMKASDGPIPELASPNPACVYGKTKAQGEANVLRICGDSAIVVRTAWLYSARTENFFTKILRRALSHDSTNVVNDQWGQPTSASDAADLIISLVENTSAWTNSRIFHATNGGRTNWCDFARKIYWHAGSDPGLVTAIGSNELRRRAPRPNWSVLSHNSWAASQLPLPRHWEAALQDQFLDAPPRSS
jgi:dTDP-4-dehydrorhamnose reductase